jgi:putative ABC transport system ATP-binding protein
MLHLSNIIKSYTVAGEPQQVLFGIDLEVKSGDYVAIMGRSGSGKSTLMNIIGLIDSYDDGSYLFDGRHVGILTESQKAHIRGRKI